MPVSLPILVGVTGTNGKTSVTTMLASLLTGMGVPAAAIGQRVETPQGLRSRDEVPSGVMGLPSYIKWLSETHGLKVIAIEAYSAALAKGLHDHVEYDAIAFTNITEDHINVHGNMQAYKAAKNILFSRLKPKGLAVYDKDATGLEHISQQATRHAVSLYDVSRPSPNELELSLDLPFNLPFQQQNCKLAIRLAKHLLSNTDSNLLGFEKPINIASEEFQAALQQQIMQLHSPPGRYERWLMPNGVIAVIDFAHNPGGIQTVIQQTRDNAEAGAKLGFLLSSKGGWGETKRGLMADAASLADYVVVSDDDPRSEDPALIRAQLALPHDYIEVVPRANAIYHLITSLKNGDTAIIAGRGADSRWDGPFGRLAYNDVDVVKQLGGQRLT